MDEFKELYENLSPNKFSIENVTQLETKVEILEQEVKQLEAALNRSELEKRNLSINYERDKKNLIKNHESLLANVSALFKTARKEIERKNNTIKELRQQLDDFIFRRHQRQCPPQNEVVQSQNEDDAICAKAVTEDRPVSSVIRPTAKNHVWSDREKSSSGDKSPLPARKGDRFYDRAKEKRRFSPYEHYKKDHERSRYQQRRRDHHDEEYSKRTAKRSSYDRDRHEFENGYRPHDSRREDGSRKMKEDRRSDNFSRAAGDDRRREAEYSAQKTIDERRKGYVPQKLNDDRRRQSPGNLEAGSRKSNEDRRRADLIAPESNVRMSIENQRKEDMNHEKSIEERGRESPASLEYCSRNSNDMRHKKDLVFESKARNVEDRSGNFNAGKLIEDRSREHLVTNLTTRDRNVYESRQRENLAASEPIARKLVDRSMEDVSRKSIRDKSQENPVNLEFNGRKPIQDKRKENPAPESIVKEPINDLWRDSTHGESSATKSTEDQSKEHLASSHVIRGRKSNESRPRNNLADSESARISIGNRRKEEQDHQKSVKDAKHENAAHEIVAKKPPCDQKDLKHPGLATEKPSNERKRNIAAVKLGIPKSTVDRKKGNLLDPKHVKKSNDQQREDAANSSQNVDTVPPHVESGYSTEGPMKAVDILAQYGVYATPYKLLNGDKCTFGGFKLVSPIADTPDHLKALFNSSKVKVSPIPMINERRVLDGFNSPAKKPVTPKKPAKEVFTAANKCDEPAKKISAGDSVVSPSPSKLQLNTVTTSPFKNCCIVKVKAEVVNNSAVETAVKEPVTVSGTDTTNAEHGVFTRKRRAPVIRHIKKAES